MQRKRRKDPGPAKKYISGEVYTILGTRGTKRDAKGFADKFRTSKRSLRVVKDTRHRKLARGYKGKPTTVWVIYERKKK